MCYCRDVGPDDSSLMSRQMTLPVAWHMAGGSVNQIANETKFALREVQ